MKQLLFLFLVFMMLLSVFPVAAQNSENGLIVKESQDLITIHNEYGTDITSQSIRVNTSNYQLQAITSMQNLIWTSDNADIATIDQNGLVNFRQSGQVSITVKNSENENINASLTIYYDPETVLILNEGKVDICGSTYYIDTSGYQLTVQPPLGEEPENYSWFCQDDDATVDQTGLVTFKKPGSVWIFVNSNSYENRYVSAELFYNPAGVIIQHEQENITGSFRNIYTPNYQMDLTRIFENAPEHFTWTSSDAGIATVNTSGAVYFSKEGKVTFTATAEDGSGNSVSTTLKYKNNTTGISLQNSSGEDITGEARVINISSYQLNTYPIEQGMSSNFILSTNDNTIAVVDEGGFVNFNKPGTVTINAVNTENPEKSASVQLSYDPKALNIRNAVGYDISGQNLIINSNSYLIQIATSLPNVPQNFTWNSNDEDTATIDDNGIIQFNEPGSVTIEADSDYNYGSAVYLFLTYDPTAVCIQDTNQNDITGLTLFILNNNYQLLAELPSGDLAENYEWRSLSETVATIASNGLVSFHKPGRATIEIHSIDGSDKSAWVDLNYSPAGVIIQNEEGEDISEEFRNIYSQEYQLNLIPITDTDPQNFTWSSSDETIATVTNGEVSFSKEGKVTFTATVTDGTGNSVSTTLKYKNNSTGVVILDPSNEDITGETQVINIDNYNLKLNILNNDNSQSFVWTSDDNSIAEVGEWGYVFFHKPGMIKITVTDTSDPNRSAWVNLRYDPKALRIKNAAGIDITGQILTINTTSYQLNIGSSLPDIPQDLAWEIDDEKIATIDSNGIVSFINSGQVTIYVRNKSFSAMVGITYDPTALCIHNATGADVTQQTLYVTEENYQLTVIPPSGESSADYNWHSTDISVATISTNGLVSFKKPGKVEIDIFSKTDYGINKWVNLYYNPTGVIIQNEAGTDMTGGNFTSYTTSYQLNLIPIVENAPQHFTWSSSDVSIGTITENGSVTFYKEGKVSFTATADDGSGRSVSTTLKYKNKTIDAAIFNSSQEDITGETRVINSTYYMLIFTPLSEEVPQDFTWSSSDTSIADVVQDESIVNVFFYKPEETARITAVSNSNPDLSMYVDLTYTPNAMTIQNAAGVDITYQIITNKTNIYKLNVITLLPPDIHQNFSWYVSDDNIATVDGTGLVTFSQAGEVVVFVDSDYNYGDNTVTVNLIYDPTLLYIYDEAGNNITWQRIYTNTDSYQLVVDPPIGESSNDYYWRSGDDEAATVDQNGSVSFIKPGEAEIIVTSIYEYSKNASVYLFYNPLGVIIEDETGGDITGRTLSINSNSYQLVLKPIFANAPTDFSWSSSNPSIASVDQNGLVTFRTPGTVRIKALANDGSEEFIFVELSYNKDIVSIQNLAGNDITGQILPLQTSSIQLKAVSIPNDIFQNFTWYSTDETVASVNTNGLVTFKQSGMVDIIAHGSSPEFGVASGSIRLIYAPNKLILPSQLQEIGVSAFEGLDIINEVILPDGLTSIGSRAFYNCNGLSIIHIPDSVNYIAQDAFSPSSLLVFFCSSNNYGANYAYLNGITVLIEH